MSDRGEYRSIRIVIVDGPDFKTLGPNTKLVWFYIKLQLGPLGIGVFNAAKHVLAEQTGLTPRQVDNALKQLDQAPQFFRREDSVFWIVGGLKNDPSMNYKLVNHVKSVRSIVDALPRLRIVAAFRNEHPEWFEGAGSTDNAISDATTIGMGNGIGHTIPNAVAITEDGRRKTEDEYGRQKTKTEDKDGEESLTSPPRVELPREAEEFLARFYESAGGETERRRWRDVRAQLYDVLDPQHPGPKIRGGHRVKARSVQHLIDVIGIVTKNPPPNRDHAILWLLNKLLDPAKGPTVTELQKKRETEEQRLEERYFAEAKKAGIQWANTHDDEYRKILAEVDATFKGQDGGYVRIAREAQLTQRTSKAADFPEYEAWLEQQRVPA